MEISKNNIAWLFISKKYKWQSEYKFAPDRKFKSDYFVDLGTKKVLIEYEGVVSQKSRHTTLTGYTKDCEKYNLAAKLGYIVLRYTVMNFNDVIKDLEDLI